MSTIILRMKALYVQEYMHKNRHVLVQLYRLKNTRLYVRYYRQEEGVYMDSIISRRTGVYVLYRRKRD